MGSAATAFASPDVAARFGMGRITLLVAASLALHALVLTAVRNRLDGSVADLEPPGRKIDATLIVEAPPVAAPAPLPVKRAAPRPRPKPRPAPPPPAPMPELVAANEPAPTAPAPADDVDRPAPGEGDVSVTPEFIAAPPTPMPDLALVQPKEPAAGVAPRGPDLAAELSEVGGVLDVLPASGTYVYKLRDSRYSALTGTTTVEWRLDTQAQRYQTRLRSTVFGIQLADLSSTGLVRRFGLAPERFVQKTGTRAPLAANVDWDQRIVTFSSKSYQRSARDGTQDRVSFLFQLMALGQVLPSLFRQGGTVTLDVAGPGDVDTYQFTVVGTETVETAIGPVEAIKLDRPRVEPNFQRIEVWLAPDRRYLPVGVRFTDRRDNVTEMYFESANEGG